MSLLALGSYLRVLREARDLTQQAVATALNVSARQLRNWERGESDPASSVLAAYLVLVDGSSTDVIDLLTNPNTTRADGERLAYQHLERQEQAHTDALIQQLSVERLQRLEQIVQLLRSDPRKLDQLLGYADRLRDETPSSTPDGVSEPS